MTAAQTPLPDRARRWVEAVTGARITDAAQLSGATSATLYRLTLAGSATHETIAPQPRVLRLFTLAEWLAEEPDLAPHDDAAMRKAAQTGLPVPESLAFDADGSSAGVPAILMTHVPGRVDLQPPDLDAWLVELADVLAAIHALDATDLPWQYKDWVTWEILPPPEETPQPEIWARAYDLLQETRPPGRARPAGYECFIHRDYHQTNVLWQDERISGVVDWVNACSGPAQVDVAHCRLNLAVMQGLDAADRFLAAYRAAFAQKIGGPFDYPPYWDVITAAEWLPGPVGVYPPWHEFGLTDLTGDVTNARFEAFVAAAVGRWANVE